MKKGEETALAIMVSLIVLVLILGQYYLFFVIIQNKVIQPNSEQYIGSELDLDIITFAESNSDLIVKSIQNKKYEELEKEINKLEFDSCWELKIKNKVFNKDNCNIKNPETTIINIPDYDNNQIKIILNVEKK